MTFARQINQITKNNTIMTRKTIMTRGGQTYEAPSVEILDVMSEGVFCTSYGEANHAGNTLYETDGCEWNF